ncbi:PEP-CTERM sorting domain-containing protein [Novosphingobium sp. M1R2S20]|uniref:PEP-CTERM sorting domain-containing protein n=1 Tax=Novosphingobium rhizovicinum TaxID=3228928 RepID=A0ABV3RC83_9SPHN
MLRNRSLPSIFTASFLALLPVASAHAASGSIPLPEPSALVLLTLGIAGVAIGRKFSAKRPRD